jgi:hypothetical protein
MDHSPNAKYECGRGTGDEWPGVSFRCLISERSVSRVAVMEFLSDDMNFAVSDRDEELS